MNFFSRIILPFIILILCRQLRAIELTSIYQSSCQRQIGIILKVTTQHLHLLELNGRVKKIPRYSVLAMANYPIESIPIKSMVNAPESISFLEIVTNYQGKLQPLLFGWPIRYSTQSISFLTTEGTEVVISRDSIWKIRVHPIQREIIFPLKNRTRYNLIHPSNFENCQLEPIGDSEAKIISRIAPSEYISDPVTIKRRFDSLRDENERVVDYERQQKFYAIPQVYKNQTMLGFWGAAGSRHGKSKFRENNGSPIIENQFSSGPFGYQHIFYTGSTPNNLMLHEEPQTQFFYRFKADYFHMGFLYDLSNLLVKKYNYDRDELNSGESKMAQSFFLETGFDFGRLSFLWFINSAGKVAMKNSLGEFDQPSFSQIGYGLRYQDHLFLAEGIYLSDEPLKSLRLNLKYHLTPISSIQYSFIRRTLNSSKINYKESAQVNSITHEYKFSHKYLGAWQISHERAGVTELRKNHFKGALNLNLLF